MIIPTFENPEAFLLILCIPLYYVLCKFNLFSKLMFPLTLSDWQGTQFEWNNSLRSIMKVFSSLCLIGGYLALILSLAEPVMIYQEKRFTSRSAEIVFVVDASPSMAAIDIASGNRLDAAKQAISLLVRENTGIGYGLVSCGSQAALLVPPTMDQDTFFARLNAMEVGELGDGTALGLGLSTAVYHLIATQAPKKTIVLLTDGENNAGSVHPNTAATLAKENGIDLYIVGIGTKGSVPIQYTDPTSGKLYSGYLDSDFDNSSLRSLARKAGGDYYTVESLATLLESLKTISVLSDVEQSYYIKQTRQSLYEKTLFTALILFAIAWILRRLYLQEVL